MNTAEALAKMEEIDARGSDDPEVDHGDADDVLCELLRSLGHGKLVDIFMRIPKWYA